MALNQAASAGHLGVSPVLLDVAATESVTGIRVSNGDETQPVNVQVRVFRWQQDDTGDVYTPAPDVVASPPLAKIAPGTEHLIRVLRTSKDPLQYEHSYRVLIDELPAAALQQDADGSRGDGAIQLLIRHAVPLFFAAASTQPAQVEWRIESADDGGYRVHAHNTGGTRVRLADLALHDANGELVAQRPGLLGYALAQSKMSVLIPALKAASTTAQAARLSVKTETGSMDTELLPVETR